MTDKELAEKYVTENTGFNTKEPLGKIAVRTYLAGLEAGKDMAEADLATVAYMQGAGAGAREKRIGELETENGELIGKVAFLENYLNNARAQIEKMKCCQNCKHGIEEYGAIRCELITDETYDSDYCSIGFNTNNNDLWELKEND